MNRKIFFFTEEEKQKIRDNLNATMSEDHYDKYMSERGGPRRIDDYEDDENLFFTEGDHVEFRDHIKSYQWQNILSIPDWWVSKGFTFIVEYEFWGNDVYPYKHYLKTKEKRGSPPSVLISTGCVYVPEFDAVDPIVIMYNDYINENGDIIQSKEPPLKGTIRFAPGDQDLVKIDGVEYRVVQYDQIIVPEHWLQKVKE
jgi:hypothetical protein